MKLVVCSDAHADWVTAGVRRYEEVRLAMTQAVLAAVAQRADAFFFLGDLCDPDDAPAALRAARLAMEAASELHRHGVPSYWLAGNHDVIEDGSGDTTLSPLHVLGDPERGQMEVYCLDRPVARWEAKFNLVALPYVATSHAYDTAGFVSKASRFDNELPTIVVGHLAIPGVQPGEETTEMPRGREVTLPLDEIKRLPGKVIVMNGHYHRRQDFRAANGVTVHIPGSMARLTHGEEQHQPSFMVVEV